MCEYKNNTEDVEQSSTLENTECFLHKMTSVRNWDQLMILLLIFSSFNVRQKHILGYVFKSDHLVFEKFWVKFHNEAQD